LRETTDAKRGIDRMPGARRRMIIADDMEPREPCIVVGYNGSDPARAAVLLAARRVGSSGKLVVVNATGRVGLRERGAPDEARRRDAVRQVLLLQAGDALRGVDFELLLVPGSPGRALAAVADEHDAEEIAVGEGAVADELRRTAHRPVVVIPHGVAMESAGIWC
jgi:Universal stress protein family